METGDERGRLDAWPKQVCAESEYKYFFLQRFAFSFLFLTSRPALSFTLCFFRVLSLCLEMSIIISRD